MYKDFTNAYIVVYGHVGTGRNRKCPHVHMCILFVTTPSVASSPATPQATPQATPTSFYCFQYELTGGRMLYHVGHEYRKKM